MCEQRQDISANISSTTDLMVIDRTAVTLAWQGVVSIHCLFLRLLSSYLCLQSFVLTICVKPNRLLYFRENHFVNGHLSLIF